MYCTSNRPAYLLSLTPSGFACRRYKGRCTKKLLNCQLNGWLLSGMCLFLEADRLGSPLASSPHLRHQRYCRWTCSAYQPGLTEAVKLILSCLESWIFFMITPPDDFKIIRSPETTFLRIILSRPASTNAPDLAGAYGIIG
ncbi:uncharacterized protein BO72DRAFT_287803 [Aspergillus fijiensis CBS 313.89]|uniref:Uncharacterized protein n=1 Tax=Aspergillus fijiensis CBS 313.89 TaxID=1448319 RepID=A0A8G1RZX4_9EURO|nr:uncharacterized protein BO72DRAFT_287803 [Aspergillus fijiensis CBS 313.89]RAK80741.1 hypothetical protein BO72DRAFT_287803 [Aspergillus fijiensis CBS 313.89]